MKRLIVLLLAVTLLSACNPTSAPVSQHQPPVPPSAPSNLTAEAISTSQVTLRWFDNSNDEQGFRLYRDNNVIASLPANTTMYRDSGLRSATDYYYGIRAYNQAGESGAISCIAKTLNPSIRIRLDRIGVYDNREPWIRGNGDVYVLIGIVDGSNTHQLKFPSGEGQTYSLDKNETVGIAGILYSTNQVSDTLQIIFMGYESDGGTFEQLAYEALGIAVNSYTGGSAAGLAGAFGVSLSGIIGQLLGEEDDLLGQFELTCNKNNNWGVGQYNDVVLQDERGVDCLRLWFTIEGE